MLFRAFFWFALVAPIVRSTTLDLKIGFVTKLGDKTKLKSERIQNGLRDVFNFGLSTINKTYGPTSNSSERLTFSVQLASTDGKEDDSIKRTIDLITKHQVDVIIGPHETCQVEAKIASTYNVAMLSYFCPLPMTSNLNSNDANYNVNAGLMQLPRTFIQTKPPCWKIVRKVVTLVGHLLECDHCYPDNLVLLYFKDPSSLSSVSTTTTKTTAAVDNRPLLDSLRWRTGRQTTDAIQYKLIGELLQVKLRELVSNGGGNNGAEESPDSRRRPQNGAGRKPMLAKQLSVLNWHTKYHHGYTKNPFRRIIHRHLYQQRQQFANQSAANEATPSKASSKLRASLSELAAIYIIVGDHDQHLGLMLALDELNLLGQGPAQVQPAQQLQSDFNSSWIIINQRELRQQSLVVGVDIEPFDERADSVHFLRGLLEGSQHEHPEAGTFDPLASKYSNYLGVVPSKPTQTEQLQESIRSSSKSLANGLASTLHTAASVSDSNLTVESLLPVADLSKLIRLPVEAFYLYDSLLLIGSYFSECLQLLKLSQSECNSGGRIFNWFANRTFYSSLNHNATKFDLQAQADGFYTIISRRPSLNNNSNDFNEDDFGIIQIGSFQGDAIELSVDSNEISPIWLPFWCKLKQQQKHQSNESLSMLKCKSIDCGRVVQSWRKEDSEGETLRSGSSFFVSSARLTVLTLLALICLVGLYQLKANESYLRQSFQSAKPTAGWFDESDERNFLQIVSDLLQNPQISDEEAELEQRTLLELHCYMFPFPSCKFVHWLIALHQLKEMMFKFQSTTLASNRGDTGNRWELSRKFPVSLSPLSLNQNREANRMRSRAFFTSKHKGIGSVRLLLHKYKTINECLCSLSQLNHPSIVQLFGATLVCNVNGTGNKEARLIAESSSRGNLREALKSEPIANISGISDQNDEIRKFNSLLVVSLLNDLLDGLVYLHQSKLQFHGELRATTCMVTVDWRLKLSGFQAHHMRRSLGEYEQKILEANESYMSELMYVAPEILISHNRRATFTSDTLKLADIYSFAFVVYELLVGQEPWQCLTQVSSSKLLVERVKVDSGFRPPLSRLDKNQANLQEPNAALAAFADDADLDIIKQTTRSCWSHSPERRPRSIEILRATLRSSVWWQSSMSIAPSGNMMNLYAKILERACVANARDLTQERRKSFKLEHSLLPVNITMELSNNQPVTSAHFESVSLCLFKFILMPNLEGQDTFICQINEILSQVDKLIGNYRKNIHLVDSQVDSSLKFLVYSGDPLLISVKQRQKKRQICHHAGLVASFALQLIELTHRWQAKNSNNYLQIRCALHCGPAFGGLSSINRQSSNSCLGLSRYILYGSSLQLIDALESTSLPQRIQISTEFRSQLLTNLTRFPVKLGDITGGNQDYVMVKREAKLQVKNLGEFEAYWLLNGPRLSGSQSLMLSSPEEAHFES